MKKSMLKDYQKLQQWTLSHNYLGSKSYVWNTKLHTNANKTV